MNGPWFGDASVARRCAVFGAVAWLVAACVVVPHPWQESFARMLLLLAPFVVLPLCAGGGDGAVPARATAERVALRLACATSVAIAQALPRGMVAAAATLPWAGFLTARAIAALANPDSARAALRSPRSFCSAAAPALGVVGGAWIAGRLAHAAILERGVESAAAVAAS